MFLVTFAAKGPGFQDMEAILIGQFKERNVELEWAAVSWGGALRDDPNNGCEGDYDESG